MSPDQLDTVLALATLAIGAGLSPYAALLGLAISAYVGLVTPPDPLTGLASPTVWITLVVLITAELAVGRWRIPDLLWNALHVLVKPVAAGLVTASLVAGAPGQWAAALAGAIIALGVHSFVLGAHAATWTAGPALHIAQLTVPQTVAALTLSALAFAAPAPAAAVAALIVVVATPWFPPFVGAARMTVRAILSVTRPSRHRRGWDTEPLPHRWRGPLERAYGRPLPSLRSARATLGRHGARWAYRRGRLVIGRETAVFVAGRLQPSLVRLGSGGPGAADRAPLIETVRVDAEPGYALCLDPDAPPGSVILTELGSGDPGPGTGMEPWTTGRV